MISFRPYIRALVLAGCAGLTSLPLEAGGPIYSRYGLGDLRFFGGERSFAMGGTVIGLSGDGFLNLTNPAGLGLISRTRFLGAFEYQNVSSVDPSGEAEFARGDFQGGAMGFPIAPAYRASLLLEVSPFSAVRYSVSEADTLDGISKSQSFFGSGGLSSLGLGASFSPVGGVTMGVKMNYLYGRIRQVAAVDFADPTLLDSQVDRSLYHNGLQFTVGGLVDGFDQLLGSSSFKPLNLGFIVVSPARLTVKQEHIHSSTQSFDTTVMSRGTTTVPFGYGAGLSYLIDGRYLIAADVEQRNWSSANFFGTPPVEMRNSLRASLGLEIVPRRDVDTWVNLITYRAGIGYHAQALRIRNQPLNEMFVTGGAAFPVGPDIRLHVGLQVGSRGTTQNGLQRDTFFRLSFSLTASEEWFIRLEDE
ncbi:MAG: hypothetical protein WD295_02000 [Bacteroidota bacterium]